MIRKFVRIHFFSRLKRLTSRRDANRYLRRAAEPKINLGCGKNILPGWLNTDLYPTFGGVHLDATARWPFPDKIFSACFCEHMIEHVPHPAGEKLILEMFRTLKPGGRIRIVTPDLAFFSRLVLGQAGAAGGVYIRELEKFTAEEGKSAEDCINEIFYNHGHRWLYTVASLSALLEKAGFREIRVMRGGESSHPDFSGIDGHPKVLGHEMNAIEAFAIEACKQPA